MSSSRCCHSAPISASEKPRRLASRKSSKSPGVRRISFSKSTICRILSRKNRSIWVMSQINEESTPSHNSSAMA